MKKYKNIIAFGLATFLFSSCGGDWLDTSPTSSTGSSTVFESTENAAMAINGLCKMMTRQYLSSQGFNGGVPLKCTMATIRARISQSICRDGVTPSTAVTWTIRPVPMTIIHGIITIN